MSYDRTQVDLTNCDLEPIHIPGSIQPHGAMLVIDPATNMVTFASENIADYLGGDSSKVVGAEVSALIGSEVAHQVANAAARAGGGGGGGQVSAVVLRARIAKRRRPADVTIHTFDDRVILEFETPASPDDTEVALTLTQSLVRRIGRETEIDALVNSVARLIRAMLGYDRVMVYRFLHNGAGRVIAEAKSRELDTFLGQHFPFSDIPVQARKLYEKNWIRVIGDVNFTPIPLAPSIGGNEPPVDMSYAHLRSVSPIHCEYLRNMGVASSMSISIVVDGKLWGLIACHHNSPKVLSIPLRVATELFAQYFSLQIGAAENRQQHLATSHARRKLDAIIATVDAGEPADVTLKKRLREFSSLIACDGAGLWTNGELTSIGAVPSLADVEALAKSIEEQSGSTGLWEASDLKAQFPDGEYGTRVAGALAIPVSPSGHAHLILFRSEEAHEVEWAGEPGKTMVASAFGDRLTPRGSFETWRQEVRHKSVPWTADDLSVADAIRNYVRDILIRHNDATEEQREKAENQRALLNAELNHRVKNILSLVKSIAAQTGVNASSVDEYARSFEGRLRALSYAHDQSFAGHDGGELQSLIEAEANMHRFQQLPERFTIEGAPVGLSERAFGVFALLLHEMMTNAAKYGSLSTPTGRLSVTWHLDDDGNCAVNWVETGGPAVVAPRRKGFGSTLIEKTVTFDLGGKADLQFNATGLVARFIIPGKHIHPVTRLDAKVEQALVDQPLDGLTVLLVEDQALIALDTEEILRELGAGDVLSVPSVELALNERALKESDCAVLDLNLGSETSEAIADELIRRGVPFVFATGYRDSVTIPDKFSDIPVVRKPISQDNLSRQLSLALSDARS